VRHPIRKFHSIFLRLFRIVAIAGVLLLVLLVLLHLVFDKKESSENISKFVVPYFKGFIYELGDPPDYKTAMKLKQKYKIDIFYKGVESTWTTSEDVFPDSVYADSVTNHCLSMKRPMHPFYFRIDGHNGIFWIRGTVFPFPARFGFIISSIAVILLIVFSFIFSALRRLLHPVKTLINGTNAVAAGNLDITVPVRGSDEFSVLSDSFNKMVSAIRIMLSQKKQLLYDVSHELRSPLTRIKIALEMIPSSDSKTDIIHDIREMEIMIDELLETARLEQAPVTLVRQQVDIIALIYELTEQYKTIGSSVAINCELRESLLGGNPELLRKAFRNIIENAIKYSASSNLPVQIGITKTDKFVQIAVTDHGCGIDEKSIGQIFEPFYRADFSRTRDTGGYGLGLYICKRIIDSHKGTICVESVVGKGTTVTVTIPV
jgi:signal transduction histidine kinase